VGRKNGSADYGGMAVPYYHPVSHEIRDYRLRRYHPDLEMGHDGEIKEKNKYMAPPGRRNMFYFPAGTSPNQLSDLSLLIVLTEGELKAISLSELAWHGLSDSAEQPRFLPVALSGVWNWKGTVGKQDGPHGERQDIKGPIPDFGLVVWKDRQVIILFDSNIHTNDDVRIARLSLAKYLRTLGAIVRFADLPADCGVNGIDDYTARYGADKALALIETAYDPKAKKADDAVLGGLTEEKLAQQFEATYKDQMHYDHNRGRWYHWDEERGYWTRNETRLAFHFAREICRSCNAEEKKEFARASTYAGVERICQCSPDFAVTSDFWDRNIWLLGVPGGVIDLHSGQPCLAGKQSYITKQTAVAPDWTMPKPVFEQFLAEITQHDDALQRYLQRIAGYALTGSNREEKLFFIYGPGGNGKTKFVETLAGVLGDYAVAAPMDTFVLKRGERHPTDLASFVGARLVTSNETQEDRQWDQQLVQDITGGGTIAARFMRRDFFRYVPQFTLIIVGNHAPKLGSINDAAKRRFQIIPFTFKPKTPDEELFNRLRPEWPAVLAWMVDGAHDWYTEGLGERPRVVERETSEYFEEQNPTQAWLEEDCLAGPNFSDTSKQLYADWEHWAKENGEEHRTKDWLIKTLKQQHGCQSRKVNGQRGLNGICVKVEYQADPRTGERDDG
jgi:putative DNA primase/helicase